MIYVTGDTHGVKRFGPHSVDGYTHRFNTEVFPEQKQMSKEDYVVVCGDFGGVWNLAEESREETYWLDWLDRKPFTTLFVPGNHENYDRLMGIKDGKLLDCWLYDPYRNSPSFQKNGYLQISWNGGKVRKLRDSVLMLERGYIFQIDGVDIFCFGGANSHDISGGILHPEEFENADSFKTEYKKWQSLQRMFRVYGVSWWKQEYPDPEEMKRGIKILDAVNWKVDFVLTHEAPAGDKKLLGMEENDGLSEYLEEIRQKLEYRNWFFGHYHGNIRVNNKDNLIYEQIVRIK